MVLAFHGQRPLRLTFANHPDEATQVGSEMELRWRPSERIDSRLGWAWQDVDQDGVRRDLAGRLLEPVYAPEHRLTWNNYLGPFGPWGGALEASWVGSYRVPEFWANLTGMEIEQGEHLLVDLRLDWRPPLPRAARAFTVSLYVKDVLDEAPREMAGDVDLAESGRVALAVGLTDDGKPEIVVHLPRLEREGHTLPARLLSLARVIR